MLTSILTIWSKLLSKRGLEPKNYLNCLKKGIKSGCSPLDTGVSSY